MMCPEMDLLLSLVDHPDDQVLSDTQQVHLQSCSDCQMALRKLTTLKAELERNKSEQTDVKFTAEILGRLPKASASLVDGFRLWRTAAGGLALALLAMVVALSPASEHTTAETFFARGAISPPNAPVHFVAYVHPKSNPSARASLSENAHVAPEDGFSFVVSNHMGLVQHVALFGVDAKGTLHWFYPAYEDANANPSLVTVPSQSGPLALPDGVALEDVAMGKMTLVGFFLPQPLTVREVEAVVRAGGTEALTTMQGAIVQRVYVQVTGERQ